MIYVTSDTHFLHKNVLGFMEERGRRWETIEEMEDALIDNINSVVAPNDELYHLGDFSYRKTREEAMALRRRIRCRKVHLIPGNHDKDWTRPEVEGTFIVEPLIKILKIDGQKVVLSHYPIADWPGMSHGSIHLHGHIHSEGSDYNELNRAQGLYRYDVGVDANNFFPVSLEEIFAWFDGAECRERISWREWAAGLNRNEY